MNTKPAGFDGSNSNNKHSNESEQKNVPKTEDKVEPTPKLQFEPKADSKPESVLAAPEEPQSNKAMIAFVTGMIIGGILVSLFV